MQGVPAEPRQNQPAKAGITGGAHARHIPNWARVVGALGVPATVLALWLDPLLGAQECYSSSSQPQETCRGGHPLVVTLLPVGSALVLFGLAAVLAISRRRQPDR